MPSALLSLTEQVVEGITADDALDAGPVPSAFVAVTVNV